MFNERLLEYFVETVNEGFEGRRLYGEFVREFQQVNRQTRIIINPELYQRAYVDIPTLSSAPLSLNDSIVVKRKRIRRPGLQAQLWRTAGELCNRPDWTARGCGTIQKMKRIPASIPLSDVSRSNYCSMRFLPVMHRLIKLSSAYGRPTMLFQMNFTFRY